MIHLVQGDLVKSDCTVIGHQANCISQMKSGIAKQMIATYPKVEQTDNDFPFTPEKRLGGVSYCSVENRKRYVVNVYGQFENKRRPEGDTDAKALQAALEKMMILVHALKQSGFPVKVGLPYKIGCGLGGGNWEEISAMIETLSTEFDQDVYLYQLEV